jgi:hypothetical protein
MLNTVGTLYLQYCSLLQYCTISRACNTVRDLYCRLVVVALSVIKRSFPMKIVSVLSVGFASCSARNLEFCNKIALKTQIPIQVLMAE